MLFVFPRREQGEDICQHISPLQYNTNRAGVKVWWGICGIHYCTLEQSEKWGNLCGYLHPRSWGWAEGESGGGRGGGNPRVQAARRLGRRGDCWMGRAGGGSPALALMHCCCIWVGDLSENETDKKKRKKKKNRKKRWRRRRKGEQKKNNTKVK